MVSKNNDKTLSKLKTGRWQRQWALTKAGAKVGSKTTTQLWGNAIRQAFDKEQREINNQIILSKQANAFVAELSELKGSIVKVGQMMALYGEHILPPEIYLALRQLEENTKALDYVVIEQQLRHSLANKFDDLQINATPLGCASLAQVHTATIKHQDQIWCLKVLYPGIKDSIDSDIKTLLTLLNFAKLAALDGFDEWVGEMDQLLHEEVDYQREARMTEKFAQLIQSKSDNLDYVFKVPNIEHSYCADGVLCCEYLPGSAINTLDLSLVSLTRRNRLAKAFLQLFIYEMFEWKTLQTDPNFGNYRLHLAEKDTEEDVIGLIDFGAVKQFDSGFIEPVRLMVTGAYLQNKARVIEGAILLGLMQAEFPHTVHEDFYQLCLILVEPFHLHRSNPSSEFLNAQGAYCWAKSKLPRRAAKHAARSALSQYFAVPPKEFALLSRKLLGVYSFISALDAEFNPEEMLDAWCD